MYLFIQSVPELALHSLGQWFSTIDVSWIPCELADMMQDPVCGEGKENVYINYS